jgi:hypothetical protein
VGKRIQVFRSELNLLPRKILKLMSPLLHVDFMLHLTRFYISVNLRLNRLNFS